MIDLTKEYVDRQADKYIPMPDTGCISTYELHEGLIVVPILGLPTDPPYIGRVHSPYTVRRVNFNYLKGTHPPQVPSPGNTKGGYTFLSGALGIPAPGSSGEGNLTFQARGEYLFVAPQHVTQTGKIVFDAHPYASGVDMLAADNGSPGPFDDELAGYNSTWKSQYFDLAVLASNRILR